MGTWQVGSGKEAELPEEEQSKHYHTWTTAAGKGHRVILDTVGTTSTGSKINFKPHWMVALTFFSVFCLAYVARLRFVPERRWREGSCKQKSKMNRTSWLKSHTLVLDGQECDSKLCHFLMGGFSKIVVARISKIICGKAFGLWKGW